MKKKYLILDFGNVLGFASSGFNEWFTTPKFKELVDMSKTDEIKLKEAMSENAWLLSEKMLTEDDEYETFIRYYQNILECLDVEKTKEKAEKIAYNFAYEDDKYEMYKDTKEELEKLSKKYNIVLLSDNWPSITRILKNTDLYDFISKVYISSIYKEVKKDGKFFDYPIVELNLNPNETIFIDDNEEILDVARKKGFIVKQMDREGNVEKSKYEIVKDLKFLY